jgi:lipopolysaccharide export LptBFGC system permease protein LptF
MIFGLINLIQYLYELISLSIEKNIPIGKVFNLLIYIVPFIMTFTIPVGVLMGVLLAMGELSANGEIIAMRTNGISLANIFKPGIVFGIMIAVFHLFFFQYILPWGNKNYVLAKYEMVRKNPTLEIANRKSFSEGEMEVRVERVDTEAQRFYGIKVVNFKENLIMIAEDGYFMPKDETINSFPLILTNVISLPYVFKKAEPNFSQHFYKSVKIFIKDFDIKKIMPKGSELDGILELIDNINKNKRINIIGEVKTFHNLIRKTLEISKIQEEMKSIKDSGALQQKINTQNIMSLDVKNLEKQVEALRDNIVPKNDIYILHRKFSYAASAILMAILAAPLGLVNRRRGKEIAFGIGILVALTYNGLLVAGNFSWKLGYLSPIVGAWMPNFIIMTVISSIIFVKLRKV